MAYNIFMLLPLFILAWILTWWAFSDDKKKDVDKWRSKRRVKRRPKRW
jgi:hypothetical protein